MSATKFPTLLSPLRVGSIEVPNRAVFTAHGAFLDFYREGISPDQYLDYLERRARGGTGLIILQPVHVHPTSHALGHFFPDRDDLRDKFARVADALHRHGTKVFVQLLHFGGQFTSEARRDLEPLWSFSGVPSPEGEPSHEMTAAEIAEIIDAFGRTASLAVEAGLDGVEIHGAHGYLVQQSFSPWANQRGDEWGEPFRFLDAVVDSVRAAAGAAVVGLRLSADDFIRPERGGLGVEGLKQVAVHAVAGGNLDYLNHSEGARSAHYARAVATYRRPRGEFLPLARGLREATGARVPVVAVGRIVDPAMAEEALRDGTCDLVGLTRAQIADPDFVAKAASGQPDRIRPCVGANQGCVDRMQTSLPITCFHNPDVGRETRLSLTAASRAARVLVVGGGPAGMKAAEIAARRGHDVVLVDRGDRLGGLLLCVEQLGAAAELLGSISWLESELDRLGVDVRLRIEVDEAALQDLQPDAIVLATGAVAAEGPEAAGDGSVPVLTTADAAWSTWQGHRFEPAGQRIAVADSLGNLETALAAEALIERGAEVTVITPYLHFGPYVGFTHRKDLLDAVYGGGATVETSSIVTGLSGGKITWRHAYTKALRSQTVDAVVMGIARQPDLRLVDAARSVTNRVLLAGDSVAARSAMHAFREGDNAGREI